MTTKVKLLYFAAVKDITNKEVEEIEIKKDSWTLNTLTQHLVDTYGSKMNTLLSTSMYAIDMDYIEKYSESTTILQPNAEIAIIPPVSGG